MASTHGQMEESLRVTGRTTKCMELECFHGQMVGNMKENIIWIRNMVKEHLCGKKNLLIILGLMEGDT
jgi:hypothetical protein